MKTKMRNIIENAKGITFAVSIGKRGPFYFESGKELIRVAFLWISITIYKFDLDSFILELLDYQILLELKMKLQKDNQ